jgi:hypothetical protein
MDPGGRNVLSGLADQIDQAYEYHMGRFLAFPIPAVTFQNASFIQAYPMPLFIGMLAYIRFFKENLFFFF